MSPSRPLSPSSPSPALSICAQRLVTAFDSFKDELRLVVSIGAFIGAYTSTSPALTLLHQTVCSGSLMSCATGEFCILDPIRRVLMFLLSFASVLAFVVTLCTSISRLCTSICALAASVWLPQPFGSCERGLAASIGESGGFDLFWRVLTFWVASAALFAPVPTPRTPLCPLDTSIWLPMPCKYMSRPGPVVASFQLRAAPRPIYCKPERMELLPSVKD